LHIRDALELIVQYGSVGRPKFLKSTEK